MRSLDPWARRRRFLGGSSYGGRQASLLAAEQPGLADALLLLSYPLHPPGRPENLRTAHFPELRTPALFAHGTRDAFGSIAEMKRHLESIPAATALLPFEGAGHGLVSRRDGAPAASRTAARIVEAFLAFTARL